MIEADFIYKKYATGYDVDADALYYVVTSSKPEKYESNNYDYSVFITDEGGDTEEPIQPSESPVVSPTAIPTKAPMVSSTVMPTKAPVVSSTAMPTKAPVVSSTTGPTDLPSITQNPSAKHDTEGDNKASSAKKLKKGSKVTDKKTKAVYKITGTGKNRTVEYVKSTKKKPASVFVPASVKLKGKTYKVTSVGKAAFKNSKKLKTVKLGKNVKKINKQAFSGCTKLKNVTFGKNVTIIGANAFSKCTALTIIALPSKVTKIGNKAFYRCKKLRYILVKTKKLTAKNIGRNAFGKGASRHRVKVNKSKWKAYARILRARGMSRKAVFIIAPVKLII